MSDRDEIQRKLGIDRLADTERKEMFDKFRDAGGEVVENRRRSMARAKSRQVQKQEEAKQREVHDKPVRKKSEVSAASKKSSSANKKSAHSKKEEKIGLFDRMILFMRCAGQRVTTLSGSNIRPSLLVEFKGQFQKSITSIQLILVKILRPKEGGLEKVRKEFGRHNPYNFELLIRMDQMYNKDLYEHLVKYLSSPKGILSPDSESFISDLKKFLSPFYILLGYQIRMLEAISKGLEYHLMNKNATTDEIRDLTKEAKKEIEYIFEKFIPKFFLIFCKTTRRNLYLENELDIRKALEIPDDERIGKIAENMESIELTEFTFDSASSADKKDEEEETAEETEETDEKEEETTSPESQQGKEIIDRIFSNPPVLQSTNPIKLCNKKDKILWTWYIMDEFDREFSFILTSNKIMFQLDYHDGQRTDIKKELNNKHIALGTFWDEIKSYSDIVSEYKKADEDKNLTKQQKLNITQNLNMKRTKLNYDIRKKILASFNELNGILDRIIKSEEGLIQNSEEKLHFDKKIDGIKQLEGSNPVNAVHLFKSFASYFLYLLQSGKLSGAAPDIIEE